MQDLPYTILEHSGDLRIRAQGHDFLEALAHASLGLLSQIVPPETVTEANERPVSVSGDTPADQALAFLNELIYLAFGKHWLPKRVKLLTACTRKGCTELEGTLTGEAVDPVVLISPASRVPVGRVRARMRSKLSWRSFRVKMGMRLKSSRLLIAVGFSPHERMRSV